jgi:hypothetical protein
MQGDGNAEGYIRETEIRRGNTTWILLRQEVYSLKELPSQEHLII